MAHRGMPIALDQPSPLPAKPRVAVFANPFLPPAKLRRYFAAVGETFPNLASPFNAVQARSPREAEQKAKEAIEGGAELLLAIGGDGTLQSLANAVYGSPAALGILPAGGGNDFASALGVPREPVRAVQSLRMGKLRCVDLLRARTADGQERLYCGGGGVGLDADAAGYAAAKLRRFPGKTRYLLSALAALRHYSPKRVRVEFLDASEEAIEQKMMVAAALNTPTYGAGLRIAPEAQINDGKLNLVLVGDLSALEILRALAQWAATNRLHSPRIQRRSATRVRVLADPPSLFHADGEILGWTPVEISVVPNAIRVLVPCDEAEGPSKDPLL
ncbi:MAG TPA: YegS/Rv2252/BmrU family lipid kinase [Candidatus Acidoferrales bacterium]|nr:YegS/Rv2252/BmrU family lipid kinase [Candidatus Acidoferrales bacterium]